VATQDSQQTERRIVRSQDPSLSDEANELLTHELRDVIGSDEVVVAKTVPRRSEGEHATRSTFVATLSSNRPLVLVTFLVMFVLGGILALVTEQYWAVVVACALHAVGTLVVTAAAIALTTRTEHVSPAVAARLEEEGVGDPDAVLSDLVEEFAGVQEAHGLPEVISSGHNDRTVTADDDRARAAVEQRTAMTPTSGPTDVAGAHSAVAALPWWVVLALTVLTITVAAIQGGEMWALPAIVVPLAIAWTALQRWMARGPGSSADSQRPGGDTAGARRRLLPIGGFVVAGVIWFMVVIGWLGNLL
jgi:hypothetical protein